MTILKFILINSPIYIRSIYKFILTNKTNNSNESRIRKANVNFIRNLNATVQYLALGGGWPWTLQSRPISKFTLRISKESLVSPAKAGALLPTGSKQHRNSITWIQWLGTERHEERFSRDEEQLVRRKAISSTKERTNYRIKIIIELSYLNVGTG